MLIVREVFGPMTGKIKPVETLFEWIACRFTQLTSV